MIIPRVNFPPIQKASNWAPFLHLSFAQDRVRQSNEETKSQMQNIEDKRKKKKLTKCREEQHQQQLMWK